MSEPNRDSLKSFLLKKMQMSHIYQPVMIKTLLEKNGTATQTEIAKSILQYDFSQIEYYENVVKNMVGRVLSRHKIVSKEKKIYTLLSISDLEDEAEDIISLCDQKIEE